MRAQRVVFTDLIIVDKENEALSVYGTRKFSRNLERAKRVGKKLGIEVLYFHQKPFPWVKPEQRHTGGKRYGCPSAWHYLVVEKDGDIRPCCYVEPQFGNCFEKPLEELINSDEYCQLRRSIMEGRLRDCCYECGALVELNNAYIEQKLSEAEKRIRAVPAEHPEREKLLTHLEHYTSLYRQFQAKEQ
jgi:radical SAM protein with 4Fe4S-binding SPASM domain